MQNALDSVVLRYESQASAELERKQQLQQLQQLEAETAPPPLSSSEAELALQEVQNDLLALLNRQLYPLQVINLAEIKGLQAAISESWQITKQALIDHIEQAFKNAFLESKSQSLNRTLEQPEIMAVFKRLANR